MREELYDPDCFACERAQQDQLELEQVVDDLATLVLRLVRDLRKAAPDNELTAKALDYLKRKALTGSPLREFDGEGSKPGDAVMTVEQAVTVLRQHNAWRRGEEAPQGDPAEIGRAIDVLVDLAERLLKTAEGDTKCP